MESYTRTEGAYIINTIMSMLFYELCVQQFMQYVGANQDEAEEMSQYFVHRKCVDMLEHPDDVDKYKAFLNGVEAGWSAQLGALPNRKILEDIVKTVLHNAAKGNPLALGIFEATEVPPCE